MQNLPGASRVASMKSAKVHAEFCKQGLDTKQLWQSCMRPNAFQLDSSKLLFGRPGLGLFPRMPSLPADLAGVASPTDIEKLAAAYLKSMEAEEADDALSPLARDESVESVESATAPLPVMRPPSPPLQRSPPRSPVQPRSPVRPSLNWADEMDLEDAARQAEEQQRLQAAACSASAAGVAGAVTLAALSSRLLAEQAARAAAAVPAAVHPPTHPPKKAGRVARMALDTTADYATPNPFDVLAGKKPTKTEKRAAAAVAATPQAVQRKDSHLPKAKAASAASHSAAAAAAEQSSRTQPDAAPVPAPAPVPKPPVPTAAAPSPAAAPVKPKPTGKLALAFQSQPQRSYDSYAAALRNIPRPSMKAERRSPSPPQPAAAASTSDEAASASEAIEGLNPFAPLWKPRGVDDSAVPAASAYYYHDPYSASGTAPAHCPEAGVYYPAGSSYCLHCPHCNPQGYGAMPAYAEYEWQ